MNIVPIQLLRPFHNALGTITPETLGVLWHLIDWQRVTQIVKNLQARIVQAVKRGNWRQVRALQRLLTHSLSAKLLAIRQVTTNVGAKTTGVDGEKWNTSLKKWNAQHDLKTKGYKAQAVKVIKIPKKNGKWRKLGIPTIKDRAMQALYLLALDPIAESLADRYSYGFRKYRSCADAIRQCYQVLFRSTSAEWILEADIKGCFDHISHEWLLDNIPLPKTILKQWLKSNQKHQGVYFPTQEGTPQGAIISPTLANRVLDGLQNHIDQAFDIKRTKSGYKNPLKIHFIRYADDFIVTSKCPKVLKQRVQPLIVSFLKQRGLKLSEQKTKISSIHKGFDFLGKELRKYNGKLLIKPSKSKIKSFLKDIQKLINSRKSVKAVHLIQLLNPKIRGWANYYKADVTKRTYSYIDHKIWQMIWKWCCRRHPNKAKRWIREKYFTTLENNHWIFHDTDENGQLWYLFRAATVPIKRHRQIKSTANPYDPSNEIYFENRTQYQMIEKTRGKHLLRQIYQRQKGKCAICQLTINQDSGWDIHHVVEKYLGGNNTMDNLVLLHPICHQQVHFATDKESMKAKLLRENK